jgi:hypothetical protein
MASYFRVGCLICKGSTCFHATGAVLGCQSAETLMLAAFGCDAVLQADEEREISPEDFFGVCVLFGRERGEKLLDGGGCLGHAAEGTEPERKGKKVKCAGGAKNRPLVRA